MIKINENEIIWKIFSSFRLIIIIQIPFRQYEIQRHSLQFPLLFFCIDRFREKKRNLLTKRKTLLILNICLMKKENG